MKTIEEIKSILNEKAKSAKSDLNSHPKVVFLKGEIEAYDDCLSLLDECDDKEKPMKVLVKDYDRSIRRGYGVQIEKVSWHYCPNCKTNLDGPKIMPCDYCPCCGQRLDWGEGERK